MSFGRRFILFRNILYQRLHCIAGITAPSSDWTGHKRKIKVSSSSGLLFRGLELPWNAAKWWVWCRNMDLCTWRISEATNLLAMIINAPDKKDEATSSFTKGRIFSAVFPLVVEILVSFFLAAIFNNLRCCTFFHCNNSRSPYSSCLIGIIPS